MQPDFHKGGVQLEEKANILVKNLGKEVSQEQIHKKFEEFGEIISSKLERFNDGTSRGFAYI